MIYKFRGESGSNSTIEFFKEGKRVLVVSTPEILEHVNVTHINIKDAQRLRESLYEIIRDIEEDIEAEAGAESLLKSEVPDVEIIPDIEI